MHNFLQMAKGSNLYDSHFQDILDNLDVKLIAPLLINSHIISADDHTELEKKSNKTAVKFVLRKIRDHDNGDVVFKDCLTKTSKSQGHKKLLMLLYSSKDSDSGNIESFT